MEVLVAFALARRLGWRCNNSGRQSLERDDLGKLLIDLVLQLGALSGICQLQYGQQKWVTNLVAEFLNLSTQRL